MIKSLLILCSLTIGTLGSASVAHATQTSFPAKQCTGTCTADQMGTQATHNPPGIVFIYDLTHGVIRKFNVFMDSTCGNPYSTEGAGDARSDTSAKGDVINCGTFHNYEELPVDSGALTVFEALLAVNQENPQLVGTAKAKYQGSLPTDPVTHQPFDLPNVAWEYPNGTYGRFSQYLAAQLATETSANYFAPGLGTYLYAWQQRSRSVSVQIGTTLVNGSITWDRNNTTTLDVCNVDNDCAEFSLTNPNNTGPVVVSFVGVFDSQRNPYPSPNINRPSTPNWVWRHPTGGGGSFHFGQGLQGNGVQILDDTDACGQNSDYYLSCAWQGSRLIGCTISCQ
jgi:hypothetical protein